ncbi:hypothetical protein NQ176_g8551 [Zarea fungicola]|uniref:Uncharacterized protein n=1 Tax=Zarea fungicola TaxID=93591 RepID=A0ACC1MTR6_9HYPO|nr:hypothetical protein NQ176_g8551 [Lecanicillium fungicola]
MSSNMSTDDDYSIDPTQPLRGIIICCTSIPTEQRTDIDQKVAELGGVHKYDLTPDVTHLIVGDYDTPKYRHVARERPDIKAMDGVKAMNLPNYGGAMLWEAQLSKTNGDYAGKIRSSL